MVIQMYKITTTMYTFNRDTSIIIVIAWVMKMPISHNNAIIITILSSMEVVESFKECQRHHCKMQHNITFANVQLVEISAIRSISVVNAAIAVI